eukprot:695881-Rhodomonas_salina.3
MIRGVSAGHARRLIRRVSTGHRLARASYNTAKVRTGHSTVQRVRQYRASRSTRVGDSGVFQTFSTTSWASNPAAWATW